MKRIEALIITAILALSLCACSGTTADQTNKAIDTTSTNKSESTITVKGTVTEINDGIMTICDEDGNEITFEVDDDIQVFPEMNYFSEIPEGGMNQNSNPPEIPEGGMNQNGNPPEIPEGGMGQNGNPPEMPEDGMNQGERPTGMSMGLDIISVGDTVIVTVDSDGKAISISVAVKNLENGGGMDSGKPDQYSAVNNYIEDTAVSGQILSSEGKDEIAVLTTGGNTTLSDVTVQRVSEESTGGDQSSFYGIGSAALVTDGTLSISDSTITTDANGAAGVFAYGNGTAYVNNTEISTKKGTSGGIHVAGGGTLYAWNLNVNTQGNSSAAIRSDRGSGTIVADGGTYTSNGTGSPAVYSTADITVNNAVLTANNSEAVCIEGMNTLRLYDCSLSGNMGQDDQNDCIWNIILYQSMSGDSQEGNSTFEMVGGTLTANNGGMFYTTNTESTFVLKDVEIIPSESNEFLLRCTGNSNTRGWGKTGSNGADCTFCAFEQTMTGDIIWDSISTLNFRMSDGSTLAGAFIQNTENSGSGYAKLYIGKDCTWTVTRDSILTSIVNNGIILDENGETVTVVGTDGTVYVQGTGTITVTVEDYSENVAKETDVEVHSFENYEVKMP